VASLVTSLVASLLVGGLHRIRSCCQYSMPCYIQPAAGETLRAPVVVVG
jgi:hypothetical protein